jgi:hypothetical protein
MAGQFRVEHYSTVQSGEKVRTVSRGGHRVRIAFPPGRRHKGSGRVVEVLHPLHENPCRLSNPAELVVMMANPSETAQRKKETRERAARIRGARLSNSSGGLEEASDAYREFHGAPSGHIDEYREPTPRPVTLSEIGDLIELQIKRPTGWKWAVFDFTGRNVRVAQNVAGTQIYFVGGNQKVSRGELSLTGADNSKELIDLGEAMAIAYRTKKAQVDGKTATYEHKFGEETDVRPRLMYDCRGAQPRLYLSGGEYRVTERGIEN